MPLPNREIQAHGDRTLTLSDSCGAVMRYGPRLRMKCVERLEHPSEILNVLSTRTKCEGRRQNDDGDYDDGDGHDGW